MGKRQAPEVNAGSMADIAFLLLIFFLVTTTIASDTGINRKLPPKYDEELAPDSKIKQKNLFTVIVNKNNELLVEDENIELKDLRQATIDFLDNGGGTKADLGSKYCNYCRGKRDPESSDNPDKAVVSVQNSRETNYETYIKIQNELIAAYRFLRNREAKRLYGESFLSLQARFKDTNDTEDKDELEAKIDAVKKLFPEKISEAEAKE